MSPGIFLTGGSGFVGRRVVGELAGRGDGGRLVCLRRSPPPGGGPGRPPDGIRWITGDLLRPDSYEAALAGCDRVLHLAAATGRADREEFRRSNVEATEALLEACARRDVRRLVHVSTIAVHFDDLHVYPYAATKAEAETLVRAAGLDWTIVRPTVVLGPGGSIWDMLSSVASLPVVPIPGDGSAPVQPIHVDDLARVLADLVCMPEGSGGAHDLGGPDVLSWEELLGRIRRISRGGEPRFLHVPFGLLAPGLAALEGIWPGPPPVSRGQLSAFVQDGRVREGDLQARVEHTLMGADAILERCVAGEDRAGAGGRTRA